MGKDFLTTRDLESSTSVYDVDPFSPCLASLVKSIMRWKTFTVYNYGEQLLGSAHLGGRLTLGTVSRALLILSHLILTRTCPRSSPCIRWKQSPRQQIICLKDTAPHGRYKDPRLWPPQSTFLTTILKHLLGC